MTNLPMLAPSTIEDDEKFGMDLADRMTKALRHSGIGVQEMADTLEVSRNAVSSWINGRNRPRARDLNAFALRTGYPVAWFLKGECTPRDLNPEPTVYGHRSARAAVKGLIASVIDIDDAPRFRLAAG